MWLPHQWNQGIGLVVVPARKIDFNKLSFDIQRKSISQDGGTVGKRGRSHLYVITAFLPLTRALLLHSFILQMSKCWAILPRGSTNLYITCLRNSIRKVSQLPTPESSGASRLKNLTLVERHFAAPSEACARFSHKWYLLDCRLIRHGGLCLSNLYQTEEGPLGLHLEGWDRIMDLFLWNTFEFLKLLRYSVSEKKPKGHYCRSSYLWNMTTYSQAFRYEGNFPIFSMNQLVHAWFLLNLNLGPSSCFPFHYIFSYKMQRSSSVIIYQEQ